MSNRLFNDENDPFKSMAKFFGLFFGIWIVWILICLTAIAGLVWVAIHFIQKYW